MREIVLNETRECIAPDPCEVCGKYYEQHKHLVRPPSCVCSKWQYAQCHPDDTPPALVCNRFEASHEHVYCLECGHLNSCHKAREQKPGKSIHDMAREEFSKIMPPEEVDEFFANDANWQYGEPTTETPIGMLIECVEYLRASSRVHTLDQYLLGLVKRTDGVIAAARNGH